MLVRMLISEGFACYEAQDGVEGLSELSRIFFSGSSKKNVRNPSRDDLLHQDNVDLLHQDNVPRRPNSMIRVGNRVDEDGTTNYRQFAIDAVLIDYNMPRMNGPEAIKEMRKMGFRSPIIGVSGGDEKILKEFLQAGADNVLQKPAKSDKLVGLLLSGFHLVLQEELRRHDQTSMDGNHLNTPLEDARRLHIQRLRAFIDDKSMTGVKK